MMSLRIIDSQSETLKPIRDGGIILPLGLQTTFIPKLYLPSQVFPIPFPYARSPNYTGKLIRFTATRLIKDRGRSKGKERTEGALVRDYVWIWGFGITYLHRRRSEALFLTDIHTSNSLHQPPTPSTIWVNGMGTPNIAKQYTFQPEHDITHQTRTRQDCDRHFAGHYRRLPRYTPCTNSYRSTTQVSGTSLFIFPPCLSPLSLSLRCSTHRSAQSGLLP